jgi:uncharacterized membrane protein HdeD (DUF308 family)
MQELKKSWGWFTVLGLSLILLGTFAIVAPYVPGLALVLLLGFVFLLGGIMHLVHLFSCRKWRGFSLELLSAIVYLLAGLALLTHPGAGLAGLTLLISFLIFIEGILQIIIAFEVRPLSGWGWTLFSGIVAVLLAILIWAEWPLSASWFIGTLIGISILLKGWATVFVSLVLKKSD